MTEHAPIDVIVIGGTAVQTRAYPTLCHVGKWFADHHYETQFIDGAKMSENGLLTLTPKSQAELVRDLVPDLDNPKKRFLYVTHCLGMAAAVELMAKDCGNSRLVALSPSLPTPFSTITQPHFLKNIVDIGTNKYVPAYSWSDEPFHPTLNPSRIDALLPDEYFGQVEQADEYYPAVVTTMEERGRIKLVLPRNDWNQPSLHEAQNFSNIMHVNANHSLLDQTMSHAPDALYRRIVNFALD
jgi:hypothetical protein